MRCPIQNKNIPGDYLMKHGRNLCTAVIDQKTVRTTYMLLIFSVYYNIPHICSFTTLLQLRQKVFFFKGSSVLVGVFKPWTGLWKGQVLDDRKQKPQMLLSQTRVLCSRCATTAVLIHNGVSFQLTGHRIHSEQHFCVHTTS